MKNAGNTKRAAVEVEGNAGSGNFPPPVFLLAPPRSFTSVICGVIGQHPELFGTPELNLFRATTMSHFIGLTRLHMGLHRLVAQLYGGEQTVETVVMARNWLVARRDRTTAEVHRELCAKIAPRALVQKSPRYHRRLRYMEAILEAFPNARFIHLLRHPRGTCESYLEMNDTSAQLLACADLGAIDRSGTQPIADPQILWHDYNLRIMRFQRRVDPRRWMQINGEDFLADIDNQLKHLCTWLGVSDSPDAIAAMKHPEASPFACFGPINAMIGNDPKFLRDPVLRPYKRREQSLSGSLPWRPDGAAFHPRVIEMAKSFGYT
jgi:Sulfotransferase family